MKLKYIYNSIIILIIVILLFIFKKPNTGTNLNPDPGPGPDPNPKPNVLTGAATVNILYSIFYYNNTDTIKMSITIGSKTVSSEFAFPRLPGSVPTSGLSVEVTSINYDQTAQYLNFWYNSSLSERIYVINPASCPNFSLSDSQVGSTYDTSAVTVTGNVVTFSTNSNTLTLNFPTAFA